MKAACWFLALFLCLLPLVAAASPQGDLDAAAKKGKFAYLLISQPGTAGEAEAREMVEAAAKQVQGSVVVELNRADAANSSLVEKLRVGSAPVPLILLFVPNGAMTGILASQATVEKVVRLAPSPKKAEVLLALQSGKAVFVTAARKGMGAQVRAQESCARACGKLGSGSFSILVDMDDPAEAQFLADLGVSPAATEPVIVVLNVQGMITGKYVGAAPVGDLVEAANKKAGGCAPGSCGPGSGKTCGPTGAK
jgi:hypothetical protein